MSLSRIHTILRLFILIFVLTLLSSTLPAQNNDVPGKKEKTADTQNNDEAKLKLTLDRVLEYILRQNLDVKKALLEYKRAGTDLKKFRGIYDPSLSGSAMYSDINKSPDNPANTFQGKEITQYDYKVGIGKYFSTGTSVQLSVDSLYQNVLGAQIPMPPPIGTINLGGKGYQTTVQATLSQELLKNTFGITTRLNEQMLSNATEMKKEAIKYQLSNLVVEALVGYWNVAIAEESLETARLNLNSTKEIRNLVQRKLSLGLSEREEVLDWNSKVLQLQNAFDQTEKQLYDARLAVLRVLNMEPDTDFEILTKLTTTPPDIAFEQAIKDAFEKRVDLKNQRITVRNAELGYKMAAHETLPSVKMNMSAGSVDYSQDSYSGSFDEVNRQWSVGVEATYPLGNTEADAALGDSRMQYVTEEVNMKKLEKEVRDQVDSAVKECQVLYKVYVNTKESKEYARRYYQQVLSKFRRGRYSAVQLKLALDDYIKARQQELQSLVNYNVALLRRDLARNVIFENYGIDLDAILKRYE